MRDALTTAQTIAILLCVLAATVVFGGVTPDLAAPAFAFGFMAVLLWLGKLVMAPPCRWKASFLHWPVAAFMVYTLVRYFTSPLEYEARFELFQVFLYGLVFFTVATNLGRPKDRAIFWIVLAGFAVAQSAYAFWQFARSQDLVLHLSRPYQYHGRGGGTFICPNHLAGFLEMVLGLLLARTTLPREPTTPLQTAVLQRILVLFATVATLVGILVTYSRGGWLVAFLGLVLFFCWGRLDPRKAWPRLTVALALLAVLVGIGFKVLPHRLSLDRAITRDDQTESVKWDTTLGERTPLWRASLRIMGDHPWFGTGPGSWRWFQGFHREPQMQENPEYAHSDVLNLASDYGAVGFLLVLAVLIGFYRHALGIIRHNAAAEQRAFALGSVLGVTMILAHSFVDFGLHTSANALLLVTLMGFTVAMDQEERPSAWIDLQPWRRWSLVAVLLVCCVAGLWFYPRTALAYYWWSRGSDSQAVLSWNRALHRFARAMELDPKFPAPYADAGEIYLARARMKPAAQLEERRKLADTAADLLNWSVTLNPRQTLVLLQLAEALALLGEKENALKTFERARAVDPKAAVVYVRWGMFYRDLGDEKNAEAMFLESEKLSGDDVARHFLFDRQQGRREEGGP
jgi:O-antigen ligase